MTDLKNLQSAFLKSIAANDDEGIEKELVTDDFTAHSLMDIYRNNTSGGIKFSMKLTYPAIFEVVGEEFFNGLVEEFMKGNLPSTGNLDDYGEGFAEFLENFEPAKQLPYLPDVAHFEWLFHKSALADKVEVIDLASIKNISVEKYLEMSFVLNNSVKLFSSKYPVHLIWEMAREPEKERELDLSVESGCDLMLSRQEARVKMEFLDRAEYQFLKSIAEDGSLYAAFTAATATTPEFDLAFYLNKHIVNGTFSEFSF